MYPTMSLEAHKVIKIFFCFLIVALETKNDYGLLPIERIQASP